MPEASEQTGKLANSGRRFTDEEPRYSKHFRDLLLAQKHTHFLLRLSLLSIDPLKRILNKQFRNLKSNMKVLTMTNPWINCMTWGTSL